MNGDLATAIRDARRAYLAPLARRLATFWTWWVGEIASLVPEQVRTALLWQDQYLDIEVDGARFRVATSDGRSQTVSRSPPESGSESLSAGILADVSDIRLILPEDIVLCRRIELPVVTEENLRESVSFQLDRLTPFPATDVYFDCLITERDSSRQMLTVDLVVAPREAVDLLLNELRAHGVIPHRAFITDSRGDAVPVSALLPAGRRGSRRAAPRWRRYRVLGGACAVLAAISVTIPVVQKQNLITILEPQVQTAIEEARAGADLRQRVEQLSAATRYLREKKQARILVLEIINEVSRTLPDHTWINRLDLSGNEVQIQGQSSAAASLIQILERSPMLTNVRFRSPVTGVGDTGEERFHLSANVIGDESK